MGSFIKYKKNLPFTQLTFTIMNKLLLFSYNPPNPAKNSITLIGLQNKGIIKNIAADGKVVK